MTTWTINEPDGPFESHLVAGQTAIPLGQSWHVRRPLGMNGWIIHLTTGGCGLIRIGSETHYSKPGDCWLFEPSAVHDYDRDPHAASWTHEWIFFHPRPHWIPWIQRWQQRGPGIGVLAVSTDLSERFKAVAQAARSGSWFWEQQAMLQTEALFMTIMEGLGPQSSDPDMVVSARSFIAAHFDEDLSVAQIAQAVSVSPSHLAHSFAKIHQQGLIDYRDSLRMQRAKDLLINTGMPIKIIAATIGYENQLYFSRVFKRRVGMSPSAFRLG